MAKPYLTNPITEELIREGIIVSYDHIEKRVVKGEDGKQYEEIAVTLRYKDPRKFKKAFPDAAAKYLHLFEGNTKAQMPFILDRAIEKSINKDSVYLSHRDVLKICEDVGIRPWTRSQLSEAINWFIENEILFKSDEQSKYWINTRLMYNGMFARQLGLVDR
jgi:hypothetical protein